MAAVFHITTNPVCRHRRDKVGRQLTTSRGSSISEKIIQCSQPCMHRWNETSTILHILKQNFNKFEYRYFNTFNYISLKMLTKCELLLSSKFLEADLHLDGQFCNHYACTFEFVSHFVECDTVTVSPNQIIIIIIIMYNLYIVRIPDQNAIHCQVDNQIPRRNSYKTTQNPQLYLYLWHRVCSTNQHKTHKYIFEKICCTRITVMLLVQWNRMSFIKQQVFQTEFLIIFHFMKNFFPVFKKQNLVKLIVTC